MTDERLVTELQMDVPQIITRAKGRFNPRLLSVNCVGLTPMSFAE